VVKNPVGFPHIIQLPAFAAAWSGGGCVFSFFNSSRTSHGSLRHPRYRRYIIKEGDALNGSGTTTGAPFRLLPFSPQVSTDSSSSSFRLVSTLNLLPILAPPRSLSSHPRLNSPSAQLGPSSTSSSTARKRFKLDDQVRSDYVV
jgi:hypothetical protein